MKSSASWCRHCRAPPLQNPEAAAAFVAALTSYKEEKAAAAAQAGAEGGGAGGAAGGLPPGMKVGCLMMELGGAPGGNSG